MNVALTVCPRVTNGVLLPGGFAGLSPNIIEDGLFD